MNAKKPTYHTHHKPMTVKALRTMFHGCDVTSSIIFEVDGEQYEPVSLVEKEGKAITVRLEPVRSNLGNGNKKGT